MGHWSAPEEGQQSAGIQRRTALLGRDDPACPAPGRPGPQRLCPPHADRGQLLRPLRGQRSGPAALQRGVFLLATPPGCFYPPARDHHPNRSASRCRPRRSGLGPRLKDRGAELGSPPVPGTVRPLCCCASRKPCGRRRPGIRTSLAPGSPGWQGLDGGFTRGRRWPI